MLATDGLLSFVLMFYEDIQWYRNANIGFNSGNTSFSLPGAFTPNAIYINDYSNVGTQGLYAYRVDQDIVLKPSQTDRTQGSGMVNETQGSGIGQGSGIATETNGSGMGNETKGSGTANETQGSGIKHGSGIANEIHGSGKENETQGSGIEQGPGMTIETQGSGTEQGPGMAIETQGSGIANETNGSGMENEVLGSGMEHIFENKSDCPEIENETINSEASGVTRENVTSITIALSKPLPILLGDYVTLTCSLVSDNSSNITYIWSLNGSLLSDTSPIIVIAGVQKHNLGQYECTITRACYKYSTNKIYTHPVRIQICYGHSSSKKYTDCL